KIKVTLIRGYYSSVWEPINLMYIAAYIKAHAKVSVEILDGFFETDEALFDSIKESEYVGFSGTTPQVPHLIRLAKTIKERYPNIKTVAGGFGISLQPQKAIQIKEFDYIVLGEGEQAMLDIISGNSPRI